MFLNLCFVATWILLKQSRRVTAYLRRCPLFAVHLHSNVTELRGKCGSLVNLSGAKDILFNQRSSSALQAGADKLADAVGITVCPRGNIASCILERGNVTIDSLFS